MANRDLFGSRGQPGNGEGSSRGKRVPGSVLRGEEVTDPFERIAVLETKVDRLTTDLSDFAKSSTSARHTQSDTFKKRTDELEAKLDTILSAFDQAKGAKRMLIVLAGLASTLTGYIAAKWELLSHLFSSAR